MPRSSRTAGLFGALWLFEVAGSIMSGVLPPSLAARDAPTSAVYALDLGFALPLFVLGPGLLVRRSGYGPPLAIGSLVFLVLMALSILPMFAIEAVGGEPVDPVALALFVIIAVIGAALAASGPRHGVPKCGRPTRAVIASGETDLEPDGGTCRCRC